MADARASFQPKPLFIRPFTQWYATNDPAHRLSLSEAERDECGVWHVCHSMHSSRQELELALQLLQPKWVISTTPPCRAMELDYVRKHCYKTRITHDDPIWKLFTGCIGKSPTFSASGNSVLPKKIDADTAEISKSSKELSVEDLKEFSVDHLELKMDLSTPPITLFGRARLRDQHINILLEEKQFCSVNTKNTAVVDVDTSESLQTQKQALLSSQNTLVEPNMEKLKDAETQYIANKVNHVPEKSDTVDDHKCFLDATVRNSEYSRDDNASFGENDELHRVI